MLLVKEVKIVKIINEIYDTSQDVYLKIDNDSELNLFFKDASFNLILEYDGENDYEVVENISVLNANVNIIYLAYSFNNLKHQSNIFALKGSSVKVNGSFFVKNNKKIILNCVNKEKNSHVDIDVSTVISIDGKLKMEVIGKIEKNASKSSSHQKSRCLTIGNIKQAEVNPLLLIEENDVEASHALALGTIDKEQLYYLKSRGLSYMQSISLLCRSYLIPNLESISDNQFKERIIEKIMKKVLND